MNKERLGDPTKLGNANAMAHAASQLLYRAAAANIVPLSGDEHSNLGWDVASRSFQTRALNDAGTIVELSLSPLVLNIGGDKLPLETVSIETAISLLDAKLAALGLKSASSAPIPYDLPANVMSLQIFEAVDGLDALAAWYDLAASTLNQFARDLGDITPGPSEVRCWPHHFDIATYVSLEAGDAEEARGIGIGLSPGDGSYAEPYFYVNPWPSVAPEKLPAPVTPGHWHTEGFVGSVATGSEIMSLQDVSAGSSMFVQRSFDVGRKLLGF
ncbi:MAG: hypothetical protein AAFY99_00010 [Pseudomonadota bacterium]